jgi:flagellar protein FlgJ
MDYITLNKNSALFEGPRLPLYGTVAPDIVAALPDPKSLLSNGNEHEQLIEAGRQFEGYFISYLLKVMRETVPQGIIANKQGAYFYSFYDQEIGLRAAQAGGIGISRMLEDYAAKNFAPPPKQPSSFPIENR